MFFPKFLIGYNTVDVPIFPIPILFIRSNTYKIVILKHNEQAQRQTETVKIIVAYSYVLHYQVHTV